MTESVPLNYAQRIPTAAVRLHRHRTRMNSAAAVLVAIAAFLANSDVNAAPAVCVVWQDSDFAKCEELAQLWGTGYVRPNGQGNTMPVLETPPAPPNVNGDPISPSGDFVQTVTDVRLPGFGIPFEFTRTYRSQVTYGGDLGFSWAHSFEKSLNFYCDGKIDYHDGALNTVRFNRASVDNTTGTALYLPEQAVPLKLELLGGDRQHYVITDARSHLQYVFQDPVTGSTGVSLRSIRDPYGNQLEVSWTTYPGGMCIKGQCYPPNTAFQHKAVSSVAQIPADTGHSSRVINFIRNSTNEFLRCLSLDTTCNHPLVTFEIDSWRDHGGYGELTGVRLADDQSGTQYAYRVRTSSTSSPRWSSEFKWFPRHPYLAASEIEPYCKHACQPSANHACTPAPEDPAGLCGDGHEKNCADIENDPELCYRFCAPPEPTTQECIDASIDCPGAVCDEDFYCLTHGNHKNLGGAICRMNERLLTPYCLPPDGNFNPQTCVDVCRDYYTPTNGDGRPYLSYGVGEDLLHNIIEVKDGAGNLVVENTYGEDPFFNDFDKVIGQQWGDNDFISIEYHDLEAEQKADRGLAAVPSVPNFAYVDKVWTGLLVCTNCALNQASCGPSLPDPYGIVQRPSYAAVIRDQYANMAHFKTQYFDKSWRLLREVNDDTREVSDYNYDPKGWLVGSQSAFGDRTCYQNNSDGLPLQIDRLPSAASQVPTPSTQERFSYGSDGYLYIHTPEAISAPRAVTSYDRDNFGRIIAEHRTVRAEPYAEVITKYDYGTQYPVRKIIAPDLSESRLDDYDPNSAAPRTQIVDANGPSPLVTRYTFDSLGNVQSKVSPYGLSQTFQHDAVGRMVDRQSRMPGNPALYHDLWFWSDTRVQKEHHTVENSTLEPFATSSTFVNYLLDGPGNQAGVFLAPYDVTSNTLIQKTCGKYGPDGRLMQRILPEGNMFFYDYDLAGRLFRVRHDFLPLSDADIPWAQWCKDNVPLARPADDPGPLTTEQYQYFPGTTVPSLKKLGDGQVTTLYAVDGFARVVEARTLGGKQVTRSGLDGRGRLIWEAAFDGTKNVGPYKKPDWSDSGLVAMTEYGYDEIGRLRTQSRWRLEDHSIAIKTIDYDDLHNGDGRHSTTTIEGNSTRTVTLDGASRPVEEREQGSGLRTTWEYTDGTRILERHFTNLDPNNPITNEYQLDGLGKVMSSFINGQNFRTTIRGLSGRVLLDTPNAAGERRYSYDVYGRLTAASQRTASAHVSTTSYEWDRNNRRISLRDADEVAESGGWSFDYDYLDRLVSQIDPLRRSTSIRYIAGTGLIEDLYLPSGMRRHFMYDGDGNRFDEVTFGEANGETIAHRNFTYSPRGQLLTATIHDNYTDNTTTRSFDSLGRMTSDSNSLSPAAVVHTYALDNSWMTTTVGQGATMTHRFDSLGRVVSVDIGTESFASIDYGIGEGGPKTIGYRRSGTEKSFRYDSFGRWIGEQALRDPRYSTSSVGDNITDYNEYLGVDTVPRIRTYSFGAHGDMRSDVFQVDKALRVTAERWNLLGVTPPTNDAVVDNSTIQPYLTAQSSGYDYQLTDNGNWNSRTSYPAGRLAEFHADAIGRYQVMSSGAPASYDADDNNTSELLGGPDDSGGTLRFQEFDAFKHPVSVYLAYPGQGPGQIRSQYDALGRRVTEMADGGLAASYYVWDGERLISDVQANDPAYSFEALQVPGPGGVLGEVLDQGWGQQFVYHLRPDGSAIGISDDTGKLITATNYSAYGDWGGYVVNGFDETTPPLSISLGFQGQRVDWAANYMMGAREYVPRIGRFISTDPIGLAGGTNLYAFAGNQPLTMSDPSGLETADQRYIIAKESGGYLYGYAGKTEDGDDYWRVIGGQHPDGASATRINPYDVKIANDWPTIPQGESFDEKIWAFDQQAHSFWPVAAAYGAMRRDYMLFANESDNGRRGELYLKSNIGTIVNGLFFLGEVATLPALLSVGPGLAAEGAEEGSRRAVMEVPDSAVVCRGGSCAAERFATGTGVTIDSAGRLEGVSVNTAETLEAASVGIPNGQVGATTAGEIRAAGGQVDPSGTLRNPNHATMSGITPRQAEQLFTPTVPNPSRGR